VIETTAKPPIDQITRLISIILKGQARENHTSTTIDNRQYGITKRIDHKRPKCKADVNEELLPALALEALIHQHRIAKIPKGLPDAAKL